MPVWLQILVAIFGLVGTIFGIFGVSAYISERAKHRASKKNKAEDDAEAKKLEEQKKLEQMKHEEYKSELKSIIGEAVLPIASKLELIEQELIKVKRGVQVSNRTDLEEMAEKADRQKFISAYDKQRFESTYQSYHDLGQNGVMDATRTRILAMPESKPVTKRKSTTKKKILVE